MSRASEEYRTLFEVGDIKNEFLKFHSTQTLDVNQFFQNGFDVERERERLMSHTQLWMCPWPALRKTYPIFIKWSPVVETCHWFISRHNVWRGGSYGSLAAMF